MQPERPSLPPVEVRPRPSQSPCGGLVFKVATQRRGRAINSEGLGAAPPKAYLGNHEKNQLARRLPAQFVRQILNDFNAGALTATVAAQRLGVGLSRLYELRTTWLRQRTHFQPRASGGDHRGAWPTDVQKFLVDFLPFQRPPNDQLVADELTRRFDFVRARSAVAAYVQAHLAHLIPTPETTPRPRRRWQCAQLGELWQPDSSIHAGGPTADKPVLLLTLDDHSRKIVAGRFVPADTTWLHFQHFRSAFETHGLPAAIYTDALALFGHRPTADALDPCSQFQRALTALGVAHLISVWLMPRRWRKPCHAAYSAVSQRHKPMMHATP